MLTKIYKDKIYICQRKQPHPITGYQNGGVAVQYVCTGHRAASNRSEVLREHRPTKMDLYELDDGHLPEYRPVVTGEKAIDWLKQSKYGEAYPR